MPTLLTRALRRASTVHPAWVLGGAGLITAILTAAWVMLDTGICPPTDSEHHLFNAILYARTMHLGGLPDLWELLRTTFVGWPPASYLLLYGPLAWAISDNAHLVRIYGVVMIPIILWCTYSLGTRLGSRRAGTLAALLTLSTFGISGQLRQVSIDLPGTTAVLLAMVAMLSTRHFQRTWRTLLFGAAMGLCLLTRVQSAFYLAGPVFLWVLTSLLRAPSMRARLAIIARLLLASLMALAVSSPWWAGHLTSIWRIATSHLDPGQVEARGDPSFLAGLAFYFAALGKLAGWPLLAAALALVQVGIRRPPPGALLLLLWVVGGILGCSLGVHREPRYLLPAVPAMVLLVVLTLRQVQARTYHLAGAALLLFTAAPTLYFTAFGLHGKHRLVHAGLVEWGYTRRAYDLKAKAAVSTINEELRTAAMRDPSGASIYLLFVQEKNINFLPRLGSVLVTQLPDMAFSFSFNINIVNNRWNVKQRKARRAFLLTETLRTFDDLELLWEAKVGRYGNSTPLRLYRLPREHKWRGRINFYELHWGKAKNKRPQVQLERTGAAHDRLAG